MHGGAVLRGLKGIDSFFIFVIESVIRYHTIVSGTVRRREK